MTVPDWKIERYLLGELPANEMAELKTLENSNAEFRAELEQLKLSNEELLQRYPQRRFKIILPGVKSPARNFYAMAAGLILCATVMLFSVVSFEEEYGTTVVFNEDGTRSKGLKTGLEIWRKTQDSTERLGNNSVVKAGDLLQMRYIAEEKCYGILVSIDGNGTLTIHLAGKNGKAAELEAGKIVSLQSAYELDDAPKFEKFYLFTGKEDFALAPIAEELLNGNLPKNVQVSQVTLRK